MPNFESLAQLGIAGIVVVGLLWFLFHFASKLLDSYNRNTEALNRVAIVTEKALHQDQDFQQEILRVSRDTNDRVKDIHKKVV